LMKNDNPPTASAEPDLSAHTPMVQQYQRAT